ncbi:MULTISPECIES: hypothetical protein [unclassified Janthinobacterium]|uniref:hypothetical protein n=1 Tax=unclassified Janthinobacterium TaxID=2610881 RepID=UPI0027125232|nr:MULTISPECIES: hypothetical protein [unclassified Janthinobacterium]MDO8067141.1 hypothetical protein [Janthinobacterium sp. SUN206]MDO8070406.1 hypothetical protein [Janthinobacterium sp. SUN176]
MSHNPAVIAACLIFAMPAQAHAADSPFPGIYSVIDPVTGITQDVLKIEPFINGAFNVFPRFAGERAWAGVLSGKVMGARDRYLEDALFPQDSKVRTLAIADIGYLYRTPGDSYSRDGRSDTGYLSHIFAIGIKSMQRRPLLAGHAERSERGQHDYRPRADEAKIAVSTLSYSARPIQVGVSDAGNPANAVDTDPLNPYMSSAAHCCFYLPATPHKPVQLTIEYRWLPDGKPETRTLPLPAGNITEELLVVVQADGKLALEFRDPHESQSMTADGSVKAGNGRLYPALPAAERKAVLAAELARQQRSLKDISKKLEKLPPTTPLQLTQRVAELVEERQAAVTYLEAFSACKAAVRECDKQARAAARAR